MEAQMGRSMYVSSYISLPDSYDHKVVSHPSMQYFIYEQQKAKKLNSVVFMVPIER
jgi:hypothetical protein